MEWININDRLPDEQKMYNVYCETDGDSVCHSLHWDGTEWCFDSWMNCGEELFNAGFYIGVIYWQELPKPPTDGKDPS